MKDGSGIASAPNAGGNSLAITERQKPAPSCVAALFQMFAKRKLFSTSKKSKLLPPVRAQKFSPGRPPAGGDMSPAAKRRPLLLDAADYSRSISEASRTHFLPASDQEQNCSEMCTPGVVARLMGLTSMPAASHQTPTNATESSKLGDHRNAGSHDWSGTSRSIYTPPQKQQKTERLVNDRRHGNSSQFSPSDTQPLWSRRQAHKMASPIKSPRSISIRNKARLIEAAAKVLEPGLQSRNPRLSRRHAYLEYPCNGGDDVPGAAAALHTMPDQLGMCDVDAPRLCAIGPSSLQNSASNQLTEEVGKCSSITVRRSDQNLSCQIQPDGNDKCRIVSLNEKAVFGDSAQRTSNRASIANQDIRKVQVKNMSPGVVAGGPLQQNNLKQNALPVPCRVVDPGYTVQRRKHRSGERNVANSGQDFVSLNKRMTGSTSLRSKRKEMARFGESHTSQENTRMTTKGRQISPNCARRLHSDSTNKLTSRTAAPRTMEKDMIIAKGVGLVSEKPKSASSNRARSDLQRQAMSRKVSRYNKKSGTASFTFGSPMNLAPTSSPGDDASRTGSPVHGSSVHTSPRRHSCRDGQSTYLPTELDFREVQGASSLETLESVFVNPDKLKNRGIEGIAASSLYKVKSAVPVAVESLGDEQQWQWNSVESVTFGLSNPSKPNQLHETHEADVKGRSPSPSITRCRNKRNTTSNLQPACADGAFVSAGAFTDSHPVDKYTPEPAKQNIITERNSSCAEPNSGQHGVQPFQPAVQDSKLTHPGKVTSTVELLLSNVCPSTERQSKESSKTFLLQTIESALATLTTSSKHDLSTIKAAEASPLRNLAIDFVLELLDLKCTELCDSGYLSFSRFALICKEERLAAEIRKEIARCSDMAGRTLDDLVVGDVERTVEGMNSMVEAFQISGQIEQDLVQELVDEMLVDMFKRL